MVWCLVFLPSNLTSIPRYAVMLEPDQNQVARPVLAKLLAVLLTRRKLSYPVVQRCNVSLKHRQFKRAALQLS